MTVAPLCLGQGTEDSEIERMLRMSANREPHQQCEGFTLTVRRGLGQSVTRYVLSIPEDLSDVITVAQCPEDCLCKGYANESRRGLGRIAQPGLCKTHRPTPASVEGRAMFAESYALQRAALDASQGDSGAFVDALVSAAHVRGATIKSATEYARLELLAYAAADAIATEVEVAEVEASVEVEVALPEVKGKGKGKGTPRVKGTRVA